MNQQKPFYIQLRYHQDDVKVYECRKAKFFWKNKMGHDFKSKLGIELKNPEEIYYFSVL